MKLELFSLGPITIHGYGLMIGLGVIACMALGAHRAKKLGLFKEEVILDVAIYGLLAGFLGAKLLYVFVEFERFMEDPMSVLGSEGFVVYGGIVLGVVAAMIYCRIKKLVFLECFDLLCASISLAQGFGRIGCFLAGCCYGRETTSIIGVVFPEGCMAPAVVKFLPTQLISSAGDFLITAILIWYYKRIKHVGDVGALYMILYAVGRFFVEFLRSDDRGGIGALSTSQWISIVILGGAFLLMWHNRRRDAKAVAEEAATESTDAVDADIEVNTEVDMDKEDE